ncbi:EAL domain-containing protein [Azospirillum sp. B4]|uniref:two-component system response regulator n=1 Tax=Azospirillum sp. B4 TaxID=95605 RepID=UPI00190066EC|nr:EAL domain-containing protein [Azospirillum sp. B4]
MDDDPANIRMLHHALTGLGDLFLATNGREALAVADHCRPDVILLDIEMPDIDGYEVCRILKTEAGQLDTPVIFVTSHHQPSHEIRALQSGGVDFLRKPLDIPVVQARVSTHLALRNRTRQLAQARRDLTDLVDRLPAFIAVWDDQLRNLFCNDIRGQWFGREAAAMRGRHLGDVLGGANVAVLADDVGQVLAGQSRSAELRLSRPDGTPLFGQVSLVHRPAEGGATTFLMLITDVSDRKQAELALFDEKERLRITLNSIGDGVIATDTAGIVTFLNPIAEQLTGWRGVDAVGHAIETILPLQDGSDQRPLQNPIRWALKERRIVGMALNCVMQRRDGELFHVEDSAAPIIDHDGQVTGAIIVFHDVSATQAMALKMTHLANHDPLTNLPSRLLLRDRGDQALRQAQRNGSRAALFLLDIDTFKVVNNTAGYAAGDALLQDLARRLAGVLPADTTISRHGADEFAILVPDAGDTERVEHRARTILGTFGTPFDVGGHRFSLTASVGIGLYPDDSEDMDALYRHADVAIYRAKQRGGNRHCFFSKDIEQALQKRQVLEMRLREAVAAEEAFEVHFQPKVDITAGRIVGAEALARWRDSAGALVSPADFIPLADETRLIVPLGRQIFRQACRQAQLWHEEGFPLHLAVNVSPVQFAEDDLAGMIREVAQDTGFPLEKLELEITEGALIRDIEHTRRAINDLKQLGLTIAIDDFGTGHSSLAYLKRFDIDVLKIDQTFVRDMLDDPSDAAIVAAIINMASALKLRLVAEGVERPEQASALLYHGCQVMQGYLYSRPLPASQMGDLLRQDHQGLVSWRAAN